MTVTHSKKHEVLTFSAKNLPLESNFFEKTKLQNFNFWEKVPKMVNLAIFDNLKLVVKRVYQADRSILIGLKVVGKCQNSKIHMRHFE